MILSTAYRFSVQPFLRILTLCLMDMLYTLPHLAPGLSNYDAYAPRATPPHPFLLFTVLLAALGH